MDRKLDAAIDEADIEDKLLAIVAEEALVNRSSLVPDAELEALGVKSADFVMILMAIEEKFGVYISVDEELSGSRTVRDLTEIVVRRIKANGQKANS